MLVYLVRHAFADHADPSRWPDDRDRPLTPEGAERFRQAARGLHRIVPTVDVVLSSPLVRAHQTAAILATDAGWPVAKLTQALAGGSPAGVASLLASLEAESVALVGHEPSLSGLLAYLVAGSEDAFETEVKKGAVACVGFQGELRAGDGVLLWLAQPKLLRAAAGA